MLSVLEISQRLPSFRCLGCRILSTKAKAVIKENDIIPKRFAKPHTKRQRQTFSEKFILDLFSGSFDKRIFAYPSILQNEEIDSLLKHSSEVEQCLSSIPPNAELTRELLKDLNKVELFGLTVPQKYGGLGYTETETKFIQECTGINSKIGRFLSCNEDLGIRLLSEFGTNEQKERYLPKLATGESFITFAYLEDAPIVDLTHIQSSAINDSKNLGYILNARKKWVHNANLSDLIIVLTKSPQITEGEGKILLNAYIVEKGTPGLSIHALKSSTAKEFGLYEVDLNNVVVPHSNLVGTENNGYSILQSALSHSFLSSSAICLALIKKMIHSATLYSREKTLAEKPLMQFEHIQANMSMLVTYAYMLETLVYFVSGRFDTFEEPDLFLETIATQIISVDVLERSIQKYIQIIGPDCFKESDIMNEALKILKYIMVFEENCDYLKLLFSSRGIQHAPTPVVEKTKRLWRPLENPLETLVHNLTSAEGRINKFKKQNKLNLKMELNAAFKLKADDLETNLGKFKIAVEELYVRNGKDAIQEEYALIKFAEIAAYLYAQTACLSRGSDAYCNDLENCTHDMYIAQMVSNFVTARIEELYSHFLFYTDGSTLYGEIGKMTFVNKEYPAEHPLIRTH